MPGYKPEYLRVRQELYNMIENDHSIKDKLPTEFELSKMFEVGRTTVRRALKLLTDEGLLIARPGMGTFVSPDRFVPRPNLYSEKDYTHIGYTHESGRLMAFDHAKSIKFTSVLNHLTKFHYLIDFITFSGSGEDAVKELKQKGIKYLIWAGAFSAQLETLQTIQDAGIKLILLECFPWEGFNVVSTNVFHQGYKAAQYLLKRGRRNLLHITYNTEESIYKWKREGFCKALDEYGLDHPAGRTIVCEDLEKVLYYGAKVDGIFCQTGRLKQIYETLDKYNIQVPTDCDIITTDSNVGHPSVMERLDESGLIAAQKMQQQIEDQTNTPFQILLDPQLVVPDSYLNNVNNS
jgi:DNA-binding LacI/PurR family transcriptional regulator